MDRIQGCRCPIVGREQARATDPVKKRDIEVDEMDQDIVQMGLLRRLAVHLGTSYLRLTWDAAHRHPGEDSKRYELYYFCYLPTPGFTLKGVWNAPATVYPTVLFLSDGSQLMFTCLNGRLGLKAYPHPLTPITMTSLRAKLDQPELSQTQESSRTSLRRPPFFPSVRYLHVFALE